MRALESWVLSYLLNSLWQVPLLFAVGWLAAKIVRPLGAAFEHRVWVAVLMVQSALPALSACDLTWSRALVPWGASAKAVAGEVTLAIGSGVVSNGISAPDALIAAVAVLYSSVCLYFMLRYFWNLLRLRRLHEEATAVTLTAEQATCWQSYAHAMPRQRMSIAESLRIYSPLTIGCKSKLLLFPAGMAAKLSAMEFESVVAHECAHILREDFARNLLYDFLALPVSYHPLLHMTRRNLAATREMVCDELAAGEHNRNTYAKSLMHVASLLVGSQQTPTPHAIGIFDTNTLERRIMNLTGKLKRVHGARRAISLTACAVLGLGVVVSSVAMSTNVRAMAAAQDEHTNGSAKRLQVSSKEMQGNLIHKVTPKYPIEAKQKHIQGKVVLDAVINKKGAVENLKATSGPKELQQSAIDAVRQWKYKPFLLNGNPIEVETTVNVTYSLAK